MSMSKKDFIALADALRNADCWEVSIATDERFMVDSDLLRLLADFCQSQSPNFMRERWLDYIAGKCGPNGGSK